jgi:dipeptidyl aminopeptidase/acylaminoacyl peptidase
VDVRTLLACCGVLLGLALAPAAFAASGIAFSDASGSLFFGSLQGSGLRTLFESDESTGLEAVDVSPDGSKVLAVEYGDLERLVLVPVAGGTRVGVAGTDGATSASFSPDGSQLVFAVNQYSSGSLAPGIYTVAAAGGTPRRIVATPDDSSDALPQFSPDGTKIAFVRDTIDSSDNETVTLELMPASGGALKGLATGLVPDLSSGGRLSFSPDGTRIAYAGDYTGAGIYTVAVGGGGPTQLTAEPDYWPAFSSDGTKVFFARDAGGDNADDNAGRPVAPTSGDDLYELWSVRKDGSGEAVLAEGDFEDLAVAPAGGGLAAGAAAGAATPPNAATATSAATKTTTVAKAAAAAKSLATAVKVKAKGSRYTVTWRGKATRWKVILKVGTKTVSATVKGVVHSHTFVVPGPKGRVSVHVKLA